MSFFIPQTLIMALAVATTLLAVWITGGFAAALAGAAIADLALTVVERRRTRHAPIEVQRD